MYVAEYGDFNGKSPLDESIYGEVLMSRRRDCTYLPRRELQ